MLSAHHGRDMIQDLTLTAKPRRHGHRPVGQADRQHGRLPRPRRPGRAAARRVHVQRHLQVPGLPVRVHRRVHQHHQDRRLPRRRPARGDLRHRADHGRARGRARASTRWRSGGATGSRTRSSRSPRCAGCRTTRATTRRPPTRRWSCSATTSCGPSRPSAASVERPGAAGHRHLDLHRDVRAGAVAGARRAALRRRRLGVARRSGCCRPARSRSSPARPRTARATRPRGARSSPTSSACRSTTSRCCTATPGSSVKGMDTYGSRSLAVGGVAMVMACEKVDEKAKPIAAHMLECSRRRPRVHRRARSGSGARPRRPRRWPRSRCAVFAAHNLPDGVEPTPGLRGDLRPGQLLVPARHAPVRGRGGHRDRRGHDPQLRRRRRRRQGDQPADRRGPGARRRGPGHRPGAVRGGRVRRERQPDHRLVRRVPAAERGRPADDHDRPDRDPGDRRIRSGVKGVGEAGTIASTPAVVNAVVDALRPCGVNDIAMPCTPERVWRAPDQGSSASDGGGAS